MVLFNLKFCRSIARKKLSMCEFIRLICGQNNKIFLDNKLRVLKIIILKLYIYRIRICNSTQKDYC